ncbi:MAG: hypothetical protein DMG67_19585 [Acidobacteria bacterium]|nr:MAG: hypothetical protein DMG67_19585 [Acidobacteriota bacterium]
MIQGWIEVGDVIALKVGWPYVLIAKTRFQAQITGDLPVVVNVGLGVVVAEVADRIRRLL